MNCLPVIERELRVLVRLPRTYYSRSIGALVAAVMCLGMLYAGFGGLLSATSAGKNLFIGLSLLAYVYVLIDGAFLTSDCLSQEKREGTMGLLFLTDLKGYDIVAGKLISRSLNAGYCVTAALPALGLAIFLGGVTGVDFLRMTLALINGLFFSVSFGILVSAVCRNERRALSGALFGVLIFGFVVPAIGFSLQHFTNAPALHPLFLIFNPAGSVLGALGLGKGHPATLYFGWSWLTTHWLSWFFLALASIILPRAWQDKPTTPRFSIRSWMRLKSWRSASKPLSRGKAGHWLNVNPILWLGERPGEKGLGVAAALTFFVIVWICGWMFFRKLWLDLPVYFLSAFLLHAILMHATALQACRGAAEDRRSGVLELLLTTPVGDDMIVRGRLLALKRQLLRPILFVLAADLGLIVAGCIKIGDLSLEAGGWVALFFILVAKLFADLYALSWVGVWQGWKSKSANHAIRQTLYDVVLLRWLILLGLVAALGLFTGGQAFRSPAGGIFGVVAYLGLLLMSLLHFTGMAMSELKDDFRRLADGDSEANAHRRFAWWPFRSGSGSSPRPSAPLHRDHRLSVPSSTTFVKRT
jgi:ABC-type transport system involved in multi-copper enzyme maturation permease subunit